MPIITDTDGKPGLRIETAASVTARDMIAKHIHAFKFAIKTDRGAGQTTTAAYVEGLAGVMALVIAGGHGSRDEVVAMVCERLGAEVNKVLQALRPN